MKSKLSKTTRVVLKLIVESNGPIKSDDLVSGLNFNLRTIRYALKTLCDSQLIVRVPNLSDSFFFHFFFLVFLRLLNYSCLEI